MDLENFGGASTLLCIDFLKLWGGQWPPWPTVIDLGLKTTIILKFFGSYQEA